MRLLQGIDQEFGDEARAPEAAAPQGLAGWVLSLAQGKWRELGSRQKQLRLLETLAVGGKKQLMLIECAGESFLVGVGADSVQAIVRVQSLKAKDLREEMMSASCR